jgi:hypothetical protein
LAHIVQSSTGRKIQIITDLGDLSQLLGIDITRDMSARTISLDHSKYSRDILAKNGMIYCKPSSLHMDPNFMSGLAHMDSPPLSGSAKDVYTNLLGSLHYAVGSTRPYVSRALSILGSAHAHSTRAHLHAPKKVVRYFHGSVEP